MVGVGVPCADMVFEGRRRAVVEWWFRASSRVMDVVVGKVTAPLAYRVVGVIITKSGRR